jgi:sugar lactone lactonase YvrE
MKRNVGGRVFHAALLLVLLIPVSRAAEGDAEGVELLRDPSLSKGVAQGHANHLPPAERADCLACNAAHVAIPVADAHYSFGTTSTKDGSVLFTEFNRRVIQRWNPLHRQTDVWRARETPGVFGIAAHADGDVFVGLDLGDEGNPGKILRIAADGTEEHVVEGIKRPRQLACDAAGNLYAAIEGGKILTWSRSTGTTAELMTATVPVSGVAVGPDGSVYLSEYGRFSHVPEGYSRPESPGLVKVRRPDGTVSVLADGFWRARGIALHGRHLYLCTEANREDQGNSGLLVRIDTGSGEQETIMERLDYPQFPATDARGHIFFTLGRDNKLMHVDPAAAFRMVTAPAPGVNTAAVRGGRVQWETPSDGIPFSLESQRLTIRGDLLPDKDAGSMDGYFDVPASHFTLSPRPLHETFDRDHPAPGVFELPSVRAECDSGAISVQVLPLRRHQGQRWPMRNVGTRDESPAPGFDEQPEAFRFYFHWETSERR